MEPHPADAGDMVVGWLTRIAATLAVVGLIAFEALSILVAHVQLSDTAASAGTTGMSAYVSTHNLNTAYNQAELVAEDAGARINQHSFRVNADGSLEFTIRKTANTLVLQHIGATQGWTHVHTHVVIAPNSFSGS
jgi:hypothetical protein